MLVIAIQTSKTKNQHPSSNFKFNKNRKNHVFTIHICASVVIFLVNDSPNLRFENYFNHETLNCAVGLPVQGLGVCAGCQKPTADNQRESLRNPKTNDQREPVWEQKSKNQTQILTFKNTEGVIPKD